jgi:hypothetical protein
LDGTDSGLRGQFNQVRGQMNQILTMQTNDSTKTFLVKFLGDLESSVLNFCKERFADVEMPSQKLVVLAGKEK